MAAGSCASRAGSAAWPSPGRSRGVWMAARATAPDRIFYHHCDEITLPPAGEIRLRGWVVSGSPAASISVALEGEDIGEAELGSRAANIGNLFPMFPPPRATG